MRLWSWSTQPGALTHRLGQASAGWRHWRRSTQVHCGSPFPVRHWGLLAVQGSAGAGGPIRTAGCRPGAPQRAGAQPQQSPTAVLVCAHPNSKPLASLPATLTAGWARRMRRADQDWRGSLGECSPCARVRRPATWRSRVAFVFVFHGAIRISTTAKRSGSMAEQVMSPLWTGQRRSWGFCWSHSPEESPFHGNLVPPARSHSWPSANLMRVFLNSRQRGEYSNGKST